MNMKLFSVAFVLIAAVIGFSQPPGDRPGRPSQGPPPGERAPQNGRPGDWLRPLDSNGNGNLESEELRAAMDRTFAELDRNKNGSIDVDEIPQHPKGPPPDFDQQPGPPRPGINGERPPGDGKRILPPFFFIDRVRGSESAVSRAAFDQTVRAVFSEMDKDGDGVLIRDETRQMPKPPAGRGPEPQMPPNARFIGAEMRFGDKLVSGQPFSAETVIEDTRMLFDGTLVKKEIRGNIYRDSSGRTRREQPLGMVGGVNIVGGDKKPQLMIFINDFGAKVQYFLDQNNKVARRSRLDAGYDGRPREGERPGARTVSDGTKLVEGISCVGTRTEFEIPAGELGNDKPMKVVDESWFSPELQVVVMSLHSDPVAGIHIFKLVNIKRSEPAAELFTVPAGYRIDDQR